jgi:iron complex outermembrane recepter protein
MAFLAVSGLFLSFNSVAAESAEEIVVTATRFNSGLSDAPANVSFITEQDIARSGATTLAQLLQQQAGVQVLELFGITGSKARVDTGGFGATSNQNTLVLLNGRRLNDVDLSGYNLAALPLASIARIEILHGSGAVLYGDNASGGVINIVTRTGFEGPTASITARTGSYQTDDLALNLNVHSEHTAASVSAQGTESDGYRANSAFSNRNLFTDITQVAGDTRYGIRATASSETTRLPDALNEPLYLSNPRQSVGGLYRTSEDQQSVEGYVSGTNFAAELALRGKRQDALLYGATKANLDTLSFTPRYTNRLWGQTFVTGLDLYRSTLATHADFGPGTLNASDTRRDSLAAYLTDTVALGSGIALNLGARRQTVNLDMTNTDLTTSIVTNAKREDWLTAWDTTLSWRRNGVRVYARLAESFRFPVLDEMWSYYYGTITPLRPQRGHHVEVGTSETFGAYRLEANAFRILLKDEIAYDSATSSNVNLDPSRHDGFNLGARMDVSTRANLRLGYSYRDATLRTGAFNGNTIPEIPRNTVTLNTLLRVAGHQKLGLDGTYTGKRYFGDDFANAGKQMSPHTMWNLHYTYMPQSWKLRAAINNLTNVKTADLGYYGSWSPNPYFYYPLPERNLMFSAEKSF